MTREEAIEIASEALDFIPDNFCWVGDTYAHFEILKKDKSEIRFFDYGVITDIGWDSESNVVTKRISVYSSSIRAFPPISKMPINMQIHHLVQGFYETSAHNSIVYIVPIDIPRIMNIIGLERIDKSPSGFITEKIKKPNILQFRLKE